MGRSSPWNPVSGFIPSSNGSEFYIFGLDGRHLSTRDATTLNHIFTFQYDAAGNLSSITDAGSLVTRITPATTGTSVDIVSPRGVRTRVQLDANGYVNRLAGPSGYVMVPQHDSLGLLRTLRNPRGFPHSFNYDSLGKLTADADTLGAQSIMVYVTAIRKTLTHTNAAGEATSYSVALSLDQTVTQTIARTF